MGQTRVPVAAEQLILVDAEDRELGVGDKLQAHLTGTLHRAFSIFVFDNQKQLLIQKRALTKYHSGGLWSNTVCGHPRPGENTIDAAHRRLKEEMGFDCELCFTFGFLYRAELSNQLIEHEYDHVFVGNFDGEPHPETLEVAAWRWISMPDLETDLGDHPEKYSYWLRVAVNRDEWSCLSSPRL
jgi:isopentenyl-diphosphate delta-isomerase